MLRERNKKLRVVSLFSGCGGLDLGFRGGFNFRDRYFDETNFELVFSNDFDADAAKVYKENSKYFGGHEFSSKDVNDVKSEEVPDFDVLLAGFPCQPFSNAGNRKGVHDERGTLFYECERILKSEIARSKGEKPLAFVFENVRGILSSKMPDGTPVPQEIINRLEKVGFKTTFKLIKASDYGVPQNRYRVIMIGVRNMAPFDFSKFEEVVKKYKLPSAKHDSYDLCFGSALCDIPPEAPQKDLYWKYSPSGQKMVDMIGKCKDGRSALKKFKKKIPLEEISPSIKEGRSWKNIPPEMLPPRFKKIWENPEKYRAPNFYRRFALGEICGTITASAQPENCGITHPFENRRLTIREAARIQSFPDDFKFNSNTPQGAYKVIGNAVPPILGWVIAQALNNHLALSDFKENAA